MFALLYAKANSKEICEEISFPSLFRKMLMPAFLFRFKANYLEKLGDSRKYLYHGRLFGFPKGRGGGGGRDYGILRAWGGIYVWKSEGMGGFHWWDFWRRKCTYSEFLENATIVDFNSS